MIHGIDHIVIASPDLDELTAAFRSLGFNVVGGGRRPIGSYNRLIGLQRLHRAAFLLRGKPEALLVGRGA